MSNPLEDALREAFATDVAVDADRFTGGVRAGVRRRRQTRRAVVGAAVATLALAGAVVVGVGTNGGDDTAPPTDHVTDSNGVGSPPVRPNGLAVVGDVLYAITPGLATDCGCSQVFRHDGHWSQIGEIPAEFVIQLTFAANGTDAWATDTNGRLLASHDGARTWTALDHPRARDDAGLSLALGDQGLMVFDDGRHRMWRGDPATDALTEVAVPDIGDPSGLDVVGDAFILVPPGETAPDGTPLAVSTDFGTTWSRLDPPCNGWSSSSRGALFVRCPLEDGTIRIWRWRPGEDFHRFADVDVASDDGWAPLDDDRLLLKLGDDERIVTAAGEQEITTYLAADQILNGTAAIGDHLYIVTFDGFQESLDGGTTWRPVR
ncbi:MULTISPECIES: hypothetical protein [unclassified Nocardioides]|uniref:hypothetical protein n=1 Tax=unclassified Nocardioides TaxID=2615069 RepID=UPI0007028E12|nr:MULTISPECIES: hypothetical protein [unclassified Nocardioides]KRC49066.1 hypothetical protein ASE19_19465 [Nocardioides sp. Root79]KRC75467.1 hypothetical protein ASE20_21370 [Nocardioides sp. Root240]